MHSQKKKPTTTTSVPTNSLLDYAYKALARRIKAKRSTYRFPEIQWRRWMAYHAQGKRDGDGPCFATQGKNLLVHHWVDTVVVWRYMHHSIDTS